MTKIKCKKCGDILEGDKKGTFIICKCGSCYIDETLYYYRIGGEPTEVFMETEKGWKTMQEIQDETVKKEVNKNE